MENCQISFPRFGGVILVLFAFFFPAQPQRTHLLKISFFHHFPAEHHKKITPTKKKMKALPIESQAKSHKTFKARTNRKVLPRPHSSPRQYYPRVSATRRGLVAGLRERDNELWEYQSPPPPQTCLKRFNGGEGSCCHPQDVI